MSVEHEANVEQLVVSNQREYQQLPTITQRTFAERAFVFLYSCYSTALVVQLLSFVPLIAPVANRLPWIVLGLLLFLAGIRSALKQTQLKVLMLGILLGSIVGL